MNQLDTLYDVLVIGAGPSGLATAIAAARYGARCAAGRAALWGLDLPEGHRNPRPHDGDHAQLGPGRSGPERRHGVANHDVGIGNAGPAGTGGLVGLAAPRFEPHR